uniref:MARVEL domain-containing protein n=1 Tax=Graphocephala atropunctata TaxID=36148 RepID=A0A1B6M6T0_9HEMI
MKMTGVLSETCCWCISLRGGTKIFGYISLIGSFLLAIVISAEIAAVPIHDHISIYYYLEFFIQTFHLVTSLILLLGVYQERPRLLLPWLVSTVFVAVSEVVFLSSFTSRLLMEVYHMLNHRTFLTFSTLALLDDIYGFIIVYSYYRTLIQPGSSLV